MGHRHGRHGGQGYGCRGPNLGSGAAVCSLQFCVHMLFIMCAFIIRNCRHKMPCCLFVNYERVLGTQIMNTFYERRSCSPLLIAKKIYHCDGWMPAAVLLWGDQPWLRRLLGLSVAPQVGISFRQAVRDNAGKRWNGVAARRTTESAATNHRQYRVTGKSLDATGCTGEPLLVIAKNRVFLCILHCCMAFGRLFVAFPGAHVGNHPPKVVGEVQKIR